MKTPDYHVQHLRKGLAAALLGLLSLGAANAQPAQNLYWNTSTGAWATGANWSNASTSGGTTGLVPGSNTTAYFNQTSVNGAEDITITGSRSAAGIVIRNTGPMDLDAGGGHSTLTVGAGGISVQSGAGAVAFNKGIVLTDGFLSDLSTTTLTIKSQIQSTGTSSALQVNGTGTVILDTSVSNLPNTYGTGTNINSGTLEVTQPNAMPAAGTVTVMPGGTLAVDVGGAGQFGTGSSGAGTLGGILSGVGGQGAPVAFDSGSGLAINTAGGSAEYDGDIAQPNISLTKLGANTLTLTGTNTSSFGTTIAKGTLQIGNGGSTGSLGSGPVTNNGTLAFDLSTTYSLSSGVNGTGTITNLGAGTLALSGTNSFKGLTVANGQAVVNGTSTGKVTVGSGASIGGSGKIVGTIGGAGTVSPGDAPGILTATATDPTGGLDYSFALSQAGAPTWSNAANSGNAVLHLEGGTPFTAALTAANAINIYFSNEGLLAEGGFFTDGPTNKLTSKIANATFNYFVQSQTGTVGYDGFLYDPYNGPVTTSVVKISGANFADGTTDGYTEQFYIPAPVPVVPEPSTWALLLGGLAALAYWRARRRVKA